MLVGKEVKSSATVVMTFVTITPGQHNPSQLSSSPSVCFSLPGYNYENLGEIVIKIIDNY